MKRNLIIAILMMLPLLLGAQSSQRAGQSLRVNDLFNSRTGFSTSMTSDYVTNKWTHNFGRYVMLNFEYRFNKMKKRAGR